MNISHIDVPQYSEEYWSARSGQRDGIVRLPASSAAAFIPEGHPFITRAQAIRSIVRSFHGAETEFEGNVATEYGTKNEDKARNWYIMETGQSIANCGIFLYGDLFGTSPDGLIGDDGVAEIKCPFSMRDKEPSQFKKLKDQPHYEVQTTLEMVGSDSTFVDFIQWCPQGAAFEHKVFDQAHWEYIEPFLTVAREEVLAELNNKAHLEPLVAEISDEAFLDLAAEYVNRDRLIKVEEARQKKIKIELVAMSEGRNVRGGGVSVSHSSRKGSVDWKGFLKAQEIMINEDEWRRQSTAVQTIRIGDQ